jgi:hypothetical protein
MCLGFTLASGPAMAADEIDCSKLDMSFKGPDWKVTCHGVERTTTFDYAYNQNILQEVFASHGSEIFDAVDRRASSSRVYFTQSGTRQYLENIFKDVAISNWSDRESVGGYDTGNFDTTLDGTDFQCIGFSRYGRNRVIAGFSCVAHGGYEKAADALQYFSR